MNDILRRHSFSITFLVILITSIFLFDGDEAEIQRLSGYTMGTTYQIQLPKLPGNISREQLTLELDGMLRALDRDVFSTYAVNSELSRFNRHGINVPFIASQQMIEVLKLAQEISDETDGAFDVTVGPLVNLWGFGPPGPLPLDQIPGESEIEAALAQVGYRYLEIDEARSQISKTRDVFVDLSAIAKGYAVDQLAIYLDSLDVDSYFLEVGGELKIKGLKPGGASWVPAIEAPVNTASRIYDIFYSRGDQIAVAGSGDYRNYFEQGGIRYSHEIDPRTGRPVTHNLAAAYVIDSSAARADALATAYMVMGLPESEALARRRGQAAYFIYKTDEGFAERITDQFSRYLQD